MGELRRTEHVETFVDLVMQICWADDEDAQSALANGVYAVSAGEWRREEGGRWRFWEDPAVMADFMPLPAPPTSAAGS